MFLGPYDLSLVFQPFHGFIVSPCGYQLLVWKELLLFTIHAGLWLREARRYLAGVDGASV